MHHCEHWDSGWCYAPKDLATNARGDSGCGGMLTCPQATCQELPPINLNNSLSADKFYSTSDPREIEEAFRSDDHGK